MVARKRRCKQCGGTAEARGPGAGRPRVYCSATCREAGRHAALRALGVRRIAERAERRAERETRREVVERLDRRDHRLPVPEGVLLLTHAVYDQAIRDRDYGWLKTPEKQGLWWTVLREVTW